MKAQKYILLAWLMIFLGGCASTPMNKENRSLASASALLLDYSSGFQAGWSWIKIYSDGTIEHQERVCCPPTTNIVKESQLPDADLLELEHLILESQTGTVQTKNNVTLGLGRKIGTLLVYNTNGQKITLEDVQRTKTNIGNTAINDSPATVEILKLVRRYAHNIILE